MSIRIADLAPDQRPRERLLRLGADALTDAELVAVLLGSGRSGASAIEVAQELLRETGGVAALARVRPVELAKLPGVGPAKAATIVAGIALARRSAAELPARVIRTSADLASLVVPLLAHETVEKLVVVVLDSAHRVLRVEVVAQGAVDSTPLPVREVLAVVLRHDGRAFAIAHNHPGGMARGSGADATGTSRLRMASGGVELRFIDHLVVTPTQWLSIVNDV